MQISKINSPNFTQKPISLCNIKDTEFNLEHQGVIFELDTNNPKDEKIAYRMPFHKEFLKEAQAKGQDEATTGKNKRFYIMYDLGSKTPLAYAQTAHHYKTSDPDFSGNSTVIEEMSCDDNYTNLFEPMLASIALQAKANLDSTICLAIRKEEIPDAKNIYFSENHLREQYIDKYRFDEVIEQAQETSKLCFFG